MLVLNKTPNERGKYNIRLPISKEVRRVSAVRINKVSKENKRFLQDIGFKI